jgi:hypothetical protein
VPPRRGCRWWLRRRRSLLFFWVKRLVVFFHDCSTLPHKYISGVFTR